MISSLMSLARAGILALLTAAAMAAALLFMGLPGARAQGTDPIALAIFMENYYKQPQPQQAVALLANLDVTDYLSAVAGLSSDQAAALDEILAGSAERKREVDESHALAVLNAFYAHVLRFNGEYAAPLADSIIAQERPELTLIGAMALATAASDDSVTAVRRLFNTGALPSGAAMRMRNIQAFPFRTMRPVTHLDIDLLWVCFFASGDPFYVDKIVDALAYWETDLHERLDLSDFAGLPEAEQNERRMAIIQAVMAMSARETLLANAANHPAILGILRGIADSRTDQTGAIVAGLVAQLVDG